jgi:hypothetical protein
MVLHKSYIKHFLWTAVTMSAVHCNPILADETHQHAPSKDSSKRIYVITNATAPIKVETEKSLNSLNGEDHSDTIVMRDPNIGGKKVDAPKAPTPKMPVVAVKSPKKTGRLSFKPVSIKGTLRMPRVAFSKITLPAGLSEESQSTDFVSKSIEELP